MQARQWAQDGQGSLFGWTSLRKVREGETTNDIFAFLTINPNAEEAATHEKAMPVILRTSEEIDTWMAARRRRH
jgi:putative SOS response-associated peptidase YedK